MTLDELLLRVVMWQTIIVLAVAVVRHLFHLPPPKTDDRLHFWAVAIPAIIAAAQLGVGIAQKAKAAKLARQKRPELEDNPYTQAAYDLTGSRAQMGLGTAAGQAYRTASDRNQSSSIDAILKSGGSANNIADLYEGSQSGLRQMAALEDEAKMKNVGAFLQVGNQGMSDETRDQFFLNQYAPFQDRAALAAGLSKDGMDNIWKGVNTGAGAAMSYLSTREPKTPQRSQIMKSSTAQTYKTQGGDPGKALGNNYGDYGGKMTSNAPQWAINPPAASPPKYFFNAVAGQWQLTGTTAQPDPTGPWWMK